jgi:uroporphyrinogen-III synthase
LNADVSARSAEELAAAMILKSEGPFERVLWPRGDQALSVLRDRLCTAGHIVDDPVAYHTPPVKPNPAVLNDIRRGVDAVLIYSPSAANQLAALDLSLGNAMIVCIGPTTATIASAAGLHVDAIAEHPSDDGVLAELERCFSSKVTV